MIEAQAKADALISTHVDMGRQMVQQASLKAQDLKSQLLEEAEATKQKLLGEGEATKNKAVLEGEALIYKATLAGEKIKEDFLANAKILMTDEHAGLRRDIETARTELTALRQQMEKEVETELGQRRAKMEFSLKVFKMKSKRRATSTVIF
jgi:hypothetical protein